MQSDFLPECDMNGLRPGPHSILLYLVSIVSTVHVSLGILVSTLPSEQPVSYLSILEFFYI